MRPRRSVVGFEGSLGIQAEVPCEAGARDEDAATYPEGGNFSTPHRLLGGALLIPSSSADLLYGVVSRLRGSVARAQFEAGIDTLADGPCALGIQFEDSGGCHRLQECCLIEHLPGGTAGCSPARRITV